MVVETFDTLPKLLKRNYERWGDKRTAQREKDLGIWQSFTWKDYYEKVKYFSLGLVSMGLEPGDKICILGESKPEWIWAEMAVQAARGTAVGIFTDCMPKEVKYYIEHSESKFIVAQDQEQVDKVLQIKDELPLLKKVVYWDEKGLWNYDEPIITSFDKVIEAGQEFEKQNPGTFEKNVEAGSGEDIGLLCYSSGTTGLPKGAMTSHRELINVAQVSQKTDHYTDKEQYVAFLPPAWITDQTLAVAGSLWCGFAVNFLEKPETVMDNIREIGANILFFGPRNWESIMRTIQAKMSDTSKLKKFNYDLFMPVAYKMADLKLAKEEPSAVWRVLYFIGDWLLYRNLRDKFGLTNVRVAITGGSSISPDMIRYFQAIGVNVKLAYGLSEGALVAGHFSDDVKPETTGVPTPGMDVRIAEQGEVLVRGSNMFSGYYRNKEATEKKVIDGWYYTGDFGHIEEDGHLIVMDRMDDLRELTGSRKFSPQYIEIRLRFSQYIKEAIIVGGEDREFVTAIINIDIENVGRWAEARRIPYTTFTDLSQRDEVINLIASEIKKVNKFLQEGTRVKRFANLHREFDADEAELTRTRKLRRTFVEERYKDLISALYGSATEMIVEAPVTYRDGRKAVIKTSLKINNLD